MVRTPLSELRGSEQENDASPPLSYSEQFHKVFPMYLAMGMTYEQFWDGDSILAVDYRKADEIRNDKLNQQLWLQGMYIYEALCDVAPILRAFPKKGTKPHKYPTEPYAITQKEQKQKSEQKEKLVAEKGKAMLDAMIRKQKNPQPIKEEKEVKEYADNR